MLTPYQYGSNNPVRNIDLDGLEGVVFQDVWNGKASVVDWINNPNAWKAGLDNISSVNPFWLGYVRSYEVITGKDYNTGEAKSRVSSAIEGTGDVMFSLTLGKFLKLPKASTSLEMQMSQTAKATGQPLATPAQQAVNTVEEKELAKLSNPVQQTAKAAPKSTPKFKTPTNPPQLPLKDVPEGMSIRIMKPTEQYPNGYWRLEKPMPQGGTQGINPATMKPGSQHETHVPLPEGYWNK